MSTRIMRHVAIFAKSRASLLAHVTLVSKH